MFSAWRNERSIDELEAARIALAKVRAEYEKLKTERDALLRHRDITNTTNTTPHNTAPSGGSHFIFRVLSKDWQELHRIHEKARAGGYRETSAATQQYLDALCASGKVVRREPGMHPDAGGRKTWQPQSWRLKAKSWL